MTIRDRLAAALNPQQPVTVPTGTDVPALGDHMGNEPLPATIAPHGTDLGTLPDQSQTPDAGGWPDPAIQQVEPFTLPAPTVAKPLPRRTKWYADTVTIGDSTPRLVTPSGIDARSIIAVTLLPHTDNFRAGPDANDAQAGMQLRLHVVVRIETGPVWVVAPSGGGTIAVAVEWIADDE